eukprot:GHVT01072351.1.p3 GENE.GHVT01072351.1~~GHVT01072351.1.p3  ORF type:complete len:122 (+),score=33.07 GHVT01072351.1:1837-2202(+)
MSSSSSAGLGVFSPIAFPKAPPRRLTTAAQANASGGLAETAQTRNSQTNQRSTGNGDANWQSFSPPEPEAMSHNTRLLPCFDGDRPAVDEDQSDDENDATIPPQPEYTRDEFEKLFGALDD